MSLVYQPFKIQGLAWLESRSGLLLVSADPGCGKSVLARYLTDHVLSESATVCYFFFKDGDQNTLKQMFCALLQQLFEQRPELIDPATDQYRKNGPKMVDVTTVLWDTLLSATALPAAGPIICIVDALDECVQEELQSLATSLCSTFLNGEGHAQLKFFLTARPYESVTGRMAALERQFPTIRLRGEDEGLKIGREITAVIHGRIKQLAVEKELSTELVEHLRERMTRIPHRTYLWMHLVFDYLQTNIIKKTVKGVDSIIMKLPESVEEAYAKILSRCQTNHQPEVRRALLLVIGAKRPLPLREFNTAINVSPSCKVLKNLDLEKDHEFKKRIRDWCGLFLSIHENQVYLLHQTAKEFLLANDPASPFRPLWLRPFWKRDSESLLAETCITFLSLSDLLDDLTCDGFEIHSKVFPFWFTQWLSHGIERRSYAFRWARNSERGRHGLDTSQSSGLYW
ncbi:hypothetical protein QBC35DRAFT_518669 [Podospora australis]|uniref:NACHT domain-containing protein n=1 Tax=Podospora australis TaxID=1536484 RepID=A0AAN6WJD5_9PEZI|nr:hypothetical protein QBC35DRAFT_518669 [Podospora australis]